MRTTDFTNPHSSATRMHRLAATRRTTHTKKALYRKRFPTWRPTRIFTVPVRYPYGTRTVPVRSPVSKHVVPVHSLRERERKQFFLFSIKKSTGITCFDTGERTGTVRVPYGYRTGTVKIQVFRACFFSEAFPSIIQRFNVPCCQPSLADSRCNATTVMTAPGKTLRKETRLIGCNCITRRWQASNDCIWFGVFLH